MDSSQNAQAPRRSRRRIVVLSSFVLVLAGLGWVVWYQLHSSAAQSQLGPGGARGAMTIVAQPAVAGGMDVRLSALGTVTARNTAIVRAQVSGRLDKLLFQEGQTVKTGQALAQIDPRTFQVAVDSARAQLAKDRALLDSAQVDLARYKTLLQQDSIASQQVDTQAALVDQYKAAVQADQAAIAQAELQLSYARVTAPISGRVGLKQVDIGNLVQSSDTNGIVVITEVQPINVVFALPQQQLPQVLAKLRGGAKLQVQAWDAQNRQMIAAGTVASVDNQIDTTTGTVKLKAEFANRDNTLFPNQFVNIQLVADTLAQAVLVPAAAVQQGANGPYVYVVKDDDTVTMRKVQVGPGDGTRTSVSQGVAVGERVVVDGVDRLREGAKVIVAGQRETPTAAPAGRHHRRDGAPGTATGDTAKQSAGGLPDGNAPAGEHRRRPDGTGANGGNAPADASAKAAQ